MKCTGSNSGLLATLLLASLGAGCGGGAPGNDPDGNIPISEVFDFGPGANEVRENAPVGTGTGIRAEAVDPDGNDSVSYALRGTDLLAVDALTGMVSVAAAIDYEATPRILFEIEARSTDGSASSATFVVRVLDMDESPFADGGSDPNAWAVTGSYGRYPFTATTNSFDTKSRR